jgi:tRNA (cmo5U34)-methyltransferase
VPDFAFNEDVVRVFPDMIKRSVPGYPTIVENLGVLAAQFAQPNSVLYDLGSSWAR